MEFTSKIFKTRTREYERRSDNSSPMERVDPKLRFVGRLVTTQHERSPEFNQAISDYLEMEDTEIGEQDLRALVHECMVHGETGALQAILPLYMGLDEKILRIEGPVDKRGWQTLVQALEQEPLHVKALVLSNLQLDSSKAELLFKALGQIPALDRLHLEQVGVESTFWFSRLECPALKLQSLMVSVGFTKDIDVFPLLLKVLGSCKLRNLSLLDCGEADMAQHKILGKALKEQVELESLRLACNDPKNFMACYMPFLEMNTPLKVLDLSRCDLETPLCSKLFEVLPRSKPNLQSLSLTNCNLRRSEGPDAALEAWHLGGLLELVELDLSNNMLEEDTIVPLLLALRGNPSLQRLNLNGAVMGAGSAKAMGDLLTYNTTLISVGFRSFGRNDDLFLKPLVLALRQNTSLLRLQDSDVSEGDWRDELRDHLARNRKAFNDSYALVSGMRYGISLVLGGPFNLDVAAHMIETVEISGRDALALSSLTRETWALRHGGARE